MANCAVEALESRTLLTTVALTGTTGVADSFTISLNTGLQQYEFTGGVNTPAPVSVSQFTGFTVSGGGGAGGDSLTILSGVPTLLNDAGADGTSMSITVSAGSMLNVKANQQLASLTIQGISTNPGTVKMAANGHRMMKIGSLSIAGSLGAWNAKLDLNDNNLILPSTTPLGTVRDYLLAGRNVGAWTGTGLTSTAAKDDADHNTGVGFMTGAEYTSVSGGSTSLAGFSFLSSDSLVKYTWNGDANLDGRVTFDDYVKIDTGFNQQYTGWLNGDFNYSNNISFDDYVLIDVAYNTQAAPSTLFTSAAYHLDPAGDNPGGIAFGADGGSPMALGYDGPVRLADGAVVFTSSDLDPAEFGILSGHTRTWNTDPTRSPGGTNGRGWTVSQWPSLMSFALTGGTFVNVLDGGRSTRVFKQNGGNYDPQFFSPDKLVNTGTEFKLTDSLGNTAFFYPFSGALAGKIKRYVDSSGNTTNFIYDGVTSRLSTVQRLLGTGPTILEQLDYQYLASGKLESVVMQRRNDDQGTPALETVRSVLYEYYGANDPNGSDGDLKRVTVTQGGLPSADAERKLYRYYDDGRLHYVVEGASYERLAANVADPTTAPDFTVETYADYTFEYYTVGDRKNGKVRTIQVKGEGTYAYDYAFATAPSTDPNVWQVKTTQTLPDTTQNITYRDL